VGSSREEALLSQSLEHNDVKNLLPEESSRGMASGKGLYSAQSFWELWSVNLPSESISVLYLELGFCINAPESHLVIGSIREANEEASLNFTKGQRGSSIKEPFFEEGLRDLLLAAKCAEGKGEIRSRRTPIRPSTGDIVGIQTCKEQMHVSAYISVI
jgi:hypothetical protein